MENKNRENETKNQEDDNKQEQLADLPVEKSQEESVLGGAPVKLGHIYLVRAVEQNSGLADLQPQGDIKGGPGSGAFGHVKAFNGAN
jgi:hypothetical protein